MHKKKRENPNLAKRAGLMSEGAITRRVFKGARTNEFRGLTDAFSEKEIVAISNNPNAGDWRDIATDLLARVEVGELQGPREETDDERNWRD